MINRAKMPRQLRNKGGITNVTPRTNYFLGGIKKRLRKLIPNELADIAVKAAPFVAPFNPAIAGLMRGIGRFDQRGSISDALKQGFGTYVGGQGLRMLGGAGAQEGLGGFRFSSPLDESRTAAVRNLFDPQKKSTFDAIAEDELAGDKILTEVTKGTSTGKTRGIGAIEKLRQQIPIINKLDPIVGQQLIVGGATSAATYIYQAFLADEPPQQEDETYEEYMARRKENVGKQMRQYFDNYFKFDPEYSALDDAGKDAFVARYNLKKGGRAGYQVGGITMANTLAENIRRNLANQAAVAQQFRQARRNIPGYVEPVVPPAPIVKTDEGTLPPITLPPMLPVEPKPIQPEEPKKVIPVDPGPGGIDRLLPDLYEKIVGPAPEQPSIPPRVVTKPVDIVDLYEKIVGPAEPPKKIIPEEGTIGPITKLPIEPDPDTPIEELIKPIMPTLPVEPMTDQQILEGFAEFKRQNPDLMNRPATQAIVNLVLPGGTPISFRSGAGAAALNQYLESIGMGPAQRGDYPTEKLAGGGMPTGVMTTNKAGVMERDYRDKGGFVPVGIKEKADDVPAMLSKNEFVFTADAVRGAGNGSIDKGAQRMYDTMKRLEKRVV